MANTKPTPPSESEDLRKEISGRYESLSRRLRDIARFAMDPRDTRDDDEWFEVISTEDGVFGCIGMMACHDVCPKELPLLEVYAYLRRKALATATH